jgi:hypothetical protein
MITSNQLLKIIIIAVLLLVSAFAVNHLRHPRVVAYARSTNGMEFCVVQRFAAGDLFNTSCYYRKPGEAWRWLYYDHDDVYWAKGKVTSDETVQEVSVFRDGKLIVTFNWRTETYRILHKGKVVQEVVESKDFARQTWIDPKD